MTSLAESEVFCLKCLRNKENIFTFATKLIIMDEFIREAKRLSNIEKKACNSFNELCKPILNISYAGWLRERIEDRDVYLMVALRFISPRSLAGRKLAAKGVRKALSKNMGINEWYVSRQIGEVTYLYDHIPKFHKDVNDTYQKILAELQENNIVV